MLFTIGNADEAGTYSIMIEANMEFYRSVGSAEFCPTKHRKIQVNNRGVEGIQIIPVRKPMFGAKPCQREGSL